MRTKQMKKQWKLGVVIIFAICVLALSSSGSFLFDNAKALEEDQFTQIANFTEDKYSVTNEKNPNGIDLKTYAEVNYGKSVTMPSRSKMEINGSDDIVKIIPEELFKKEGKTLHIGKEYGFFIECRKGRKFKNLLISTVMIIGLNNNADMNDNENKSHLKFEIKPIFQADFAYVTRDADKLEYIVEQEYELFNDKYENVSFVELNYNSEGDGFVIPVPTQYVDGVLTVPKLGFIQHNKYYLTNAATQLSLYNVNHPNQYDEDYVAYDENAEEGKKLIDKGSIIIQMDTAYKGRTINKGKVD